MYFRKIILAFFASASDLALSTEMPAPVLPDPYNLFHPDTSHNIKKIPSSKGQNNKPYVFQEYLLWKPGQSLKICFYGGSKELRKDIIEVASLWLDWGDLEIDYPLLEGRDCTTNEDSQIRISFSLPGNFSYVGTLMLDSKLSGRPNMNFFGFDKKRPDRVIFRTIVLHEFGHAFGFHHEHQNPNGNCINEINWEVALKKFAEEKISTEKIKANYHGLNLDSSAFGISAHDRSSIMHYAMDWNIFEKKRNSPCYVEQPENLSCLDKKGMGTAYPPSKKKLPDICK